MSDVDTVVQSYIRTLARRGWCRQLPLVGQLDGDRAADNVSPAVTCVACRLGVREMALVVMLASFGVPAEAALATSVLMGLCLIIVGLPGA